MKEETHTTKHFNTRVSEIWIDAEGIMHVVFHTGVDIALSDMEEAFRLYSKLGYGPGGKKCLQLLSGGPVNVNKEARDYASAHGPDFFIAAAMVSDSVVMRFLVNIFNAIQKNKVPFKLFASDREALEWLSTYREQQIDRRA